MKIAFLSSWPSIKAKAENLYQGGPRLGASASETKDSYNAGGNLGLWLNRIRGYSGRKCTRVEAYTSAKEKSAFKRYYFSGGLKV